MLIDFLTFDVAYTFCNLQNLKLTRKRTADAIAYRAEAEDGETEKRSSSAVRASNNVFLGQADMM